MPNNQDFILGCFNNIEIYNIKKMWYIINGDKMEENIENKALEMLKKTRITNNDYFAEQDDKAQYRYQPTPVEYVMENPEQYIIPECLECCKLLWSKGIDTTQCSNNEDRLEIWVELATLTLSEENKQILEELKEKDKRVEFFEGLHNTHEYRLIVDRIDNPNASQQLCEIASNFVLQDTNQYITDEAILDRYKREGGTYTIDEYGQVFRQINPERQNATLEEALSHIENPELYIPEEGRLYKSIHAYNVHQNYLNQNNKKHR